MLESQAGSQADPESGTVTTPRGAPAVAPPPTLLVRRKAAAAMVGTGTTTLDDLDRRRLCPAPVRIPPAKRGNRGGVSSGDPRWRVADLALWVELGCPDRRTFEAEKKARAARAARRRN